MPASVSSKGGGLSGPPPNSGSGSGGPPVSGWLDTIRRAQKQDGGWSYQGRASWTEPTVYALLALSAAGGEGESFSRGLRWLRGAQRADGGWPPNPSVDQSAWISALATLLASDRPEAGDTERAITWLLRQSGRDSGWAHRLRLWLLGEGAEDRGGERGWPWYPETAAWVVPTAITILALAKVQRARPGGEVAARIAEGREYLLKRMCRGGGWNHGATRALGYESGPYPETTGLALLALRDVGSSSLAASLSLAEKQLGTCRSAEGVAWLRMGLRAHGRLPASPAFTCRTLMDTALAILAEADALGRNVLLS